MQEQRTRVADSKAALEGADGLKGQCCVTGHAERAVDGRGGDAADSC